MNEFQTRVLKDLEEVKIKVAVIENKINNDLTATKFKADEAHILANQNRQDIDEIKDKIKWLSRTIAGAIISGLIAIGFALIKFK